MRHHCAMAHVPAGGSRMRDGSSPLLQAVAHLSREWQSLVPGSSIQVQAKAWDAITPLRSTRDIPAYDQVENLHRRDRLDASGRSAPPASCMVGRVLHATLQGAALRWAAVSRSELPAERWTHPCIASAAGTRPAGAGGKRADKAGQRSDEAGAWLAVHTAGGHPLLAADKAMQSRPAGPVQAWPAVWQCAPPGTWRRRQSCLHEGSMHHVPLPRARGRPGGCAASAAAARTCAKRVQSAVHAVRLASQTCLARWGLPAATAAPQPPRAQRLPVAPAAQAPSRQLQPAALYPAAQCSRCPARGILMLATQPQTRLPRPSPRMLTWSGPRNTTSARSAVLSATECLLQQDQQLAAQGIHARLAAGAGSHSLAPGRTGDSHRAADAHG